MNIGSSSLSRSNSSERLFQGEFSSSLKDVQCHLKEINKRIKTWKKIATNERIDISEQIRAFNDLKKDVSRPSVLVEGEEICSTIVKKVQRNIVRAPDQSRMQRLDRQLKEVTNILIPWIKAAKNEGIDISEEENILCKANQSSLEQMREAKGNLVYVKELAQLRLKVLRSQFGVVIIRKVTEQVLKKGSERVMSKHWFDEEKNALIQGIERDALSAIQAPREFKIYEKECQRILKVFKENLDLLENDPKHYKELADREWLRRNIIDSATRLVSHAKENKNERLAAEVIATRNAVLGMLDSEMKTEEIRRRANDAFDLFAERLGGRKKMGGCGFTSSVFQD